MPVATLLKSARTLHLYTGVFLAPALLFFAFTGAVQTFSLHETTKGSSYKPPAILVTLGQLHKKQTIVVPAHKGEGKPDTKPQSKADTKPVPSGDPGKLTADATPPKPAEPAPFPARVHNLIPMKIFFLLCALGLFQAVLTGLYMSYRYIRNKKLITAILLAGIAIPPLLLLF